MEDRRVLAASTEALLGLTSFLPVGVKSTFESEEPAAQYEAGYVASGTGGLEQPEPALNALINVPETEPPGSIGQNDTPAAAQPIPGLGTGLGEDNQARISGSLSGDTDTFRFSVRAGDVIGASVVGAGRLVLRDPSGTELMGSSQDIRLVFPSGNPLQGAGANAAVHIVAPSDGSYTLSVSLGSGNYDAEIEMFRPGLEQQPIGSVQTVFLDFNGATISDAIFGGPGLLRTLSPLSTFLPGWGLSLADESAVIDAIVTEFTRSFSTDIRANGANGDFDATGINGQFDVEILNSRDHADPFGLPNVSRVIVGGTISELGIGTIGIAESIDPGNYNTSETAVVLLDLLSAPPSNPNSLNQFPLDPSVTIVDLIGAGVGNITSHEAGHFSAAFHTNQFNAAPNIMDQGGNLPGLIGIGPDGIFGSADDIDVTFGTDQFVSNEGFTGNQDTRSAMAFGLSTGTGGVVPNANRLYAGVGRGSSVNQGALLELNQNTGGGAVVGNPASAGGISGLDFTSDGRLWGSTISGPLGARTSTLIEIDPDTGSELSSVVIADGGIPIAIGDLAVQPSTDVLFGIGTNSDGGVSGGLLYTIDPTTGAATLVGDTLQGRGGGLAFDPGGDLLYLEFNELHTLDPTNAAILTTTLLNFGGHDGFAVRPSDGTLFASQSGAATTNDGIFVIDPLAGTSTLIGNTSAGNVSDLAFRPVIIDDDVPFPPLQAVAPLGSLVYQGSVATNIGAPDDVDTYTIDLDDGQTIALNVTSAETLRSKVDLYDPDGALLASAEAANAGDDVLIQIIATAGAGVYTVVVRNADGGNGNFVRHGLVNTIVASTFSDEASFLAAAGGGLAFEDFEGFGGVTLQTLDTNTNVGPISPGDIPPGVIFSSTSGSATDLFIAPAGFAGQPDIVTDSLFANSFGSPLIADFSPGVTAVGSELISFVNSANIVLTIRDADGDLSTFNVQPPQNAPAYFGIVATEGEIVRIEYDPPGGITAGIDNFSFGSAPVVGTGEYQLTLTVNAGEEEESHGGTSNDAIGTAQDINPSFIELSSDRGAVLGSLTAPSDAVFQADQTEINNVFAPNVLTFEFPGAPIPAGGGTLVVDSIGDFGLTSEFATIDAEGIFSVNVFDDSTAGDQQPRSETINITSADLAALAADGTITFTVSFTTAVNNLGSNSMTLDLSYGAAAAPGDGDDFFGFDLEGGQYSTVVLEALTSLSGGGFQASETETDNVFFPNVLTFEFPSVPSPDGEGTLVVDSIGDFGLASEFATIDAEGIFTVDLFDDSTIGDQQPRSETINIAPADLAALAADGTITFTVSFTAAVNNLGSNSITLDLSYPTAAEPLALEILDVDGNVLATGQSGPANVDAVIENFQAPETGTYFARVASQQDLAYSLVVTRDATFELSFEEPGEGGELVTNGGFETGDFSGWTVSSIGTNGWGINNGALDPPGNATPLPPIAGSFDAISLPAGAGTRVLSQTVTIPNGVSSATFSWADRIQNFASEFVDPTHEYRVLIKDATGTNTIQEIFSTNPGDPLIQVGPNDRSFDVTALLQSLEGQTVTLSFEEQDSLFFFNVTVDDVSLVVETASTGPGPDVQNIEPTGVALGHVDGTASPFANVVSETITFDEVPPQLLDGATIKGVSFDFKVGGVDSPQAGIGLSSGPGATNNVSPPLVEGNAAGILTMDFATPVTTLDFGFALSTTAGFVPDAVVVELFDAANTSIDVISVAGIPDPTFAGGLFTYTGLPATRAVVDFNESFAGGFVLDNVSFSDESSGPADFYEISVDVGDVIDVSTLTPGDGPFQWLNNLDPRLELFDPNGNSVASDNDSAADGRNAKLRHVATTAGTYLIQVSSANGISGEYVVRASALPPAVVDSIIYFNEDADAERGFSPDSTGQRSLIKQIEVTFDGPEVDVPLGPVSDSSFVLRELGGGAVIGLEVLSRTFDFATKKTTIVLTFDSSSPFVNPFGSLVDGVYELTVDGNGLEVDGDGDAEIGGNAVHQFHSIFGDSDGDGDVDGMDYVRYQQLVIGNPAFDAYLSLFDFDDDDDPFTGGMLGADFQEFARRFGRRIF